MKNLFNFFSHISNIKKRYFSHVIDNKGKTKEYIGKLEFTLDFSNNKIFHKEEATKVNKESKIINEKNVIDILLKNGFKKQDENTLIKKTKDNAIIYYLPNSQNINYYLDKDNFVYKYSYSLNRNLLHVKIFDKKTNTERENYEYDVSNKKRVSCITGSCNNYKKILDLLNNEILKYIQ